MNDIRRFARHVSDTQPLFRELRRSGRNDPLILAILAVENYFRPHTQRLMEYLAWALLSHLNSKRLLRLSVGISQAQLRWWIDAGLMKSGVFSHKNLHTAISAQANYDVCGYILSRMSTAHDNPALAVTRWYTGSYAFDYAEFLTVTTEYLCGVDGALQLWKDMITGVSSCNQDRIFSHKPSHTT